MGGFAVRAFTTEVTTVLPMPLILTGTISNSTHQAAKAYKITTVARSVNHPVPRNEPSFSVLLCRQA